MLPREPYCKVNSLLQIYGLPIIASGLLALSLAVIGAQVAARDRAMQTLCLSQGALLGVLVSIGLLGGYGHPEEPGLFFPFVGSIVGTLFTFGASEIFVKKIDSSKNTYFAAFFAVLLAAGHCVTAMFPGLETHMTQRYFGDLAVITDNAAIAGIVVSVTSGVSLIFIAEKLTKASFFESALGIQTEDFSRPKRWLMVFFILALISFSTQVMGLLFTVTALFVPTAVLSQMSGGYRDHLQACALIASLSTMGGFILSLIGPALPTVPLVSLTMVTLSTLAWIFHKSKKIVFKKA